MFHSVTGVTVHWEAELLTIQDINHIYNDDERHFEIVDRFSEMKFPHRNAMISCIGSFKLVTVT